MNAYRKRRFYSDKEIMDRLNKECGYIEIGDRQIPVGLLLKERDPIAFFLVSIHIAEQDDLTDPVWVCSQCKHEYDNEAEAENCCEPETDENE
jgi:hypothetical protein